MIAASVTLSFLSPLWNVRENRLKIYRVGCYKLPWIEPIQGTSTFCGSSNGYTSIFREANRMSWIGFYSQSSLWIVRDVILAKSSKPLVLNYFPLWAAFGSTTCSFGKLFLKPTGHAYVCRTIEVNDEPAPFISEHMLLGDYCTEGLSLSVEVAQITPVSSLLQCNHKRMLNLESTVVLRSMRLPEAIEYWY